MTFLARVSTPAMAQSPRCRLPRRPLGFAVPAAEVAVCREARCEYASQGLRYPPRDSQSSGWAMAAYPMNISRVAPGCPSSSSAKKGASCHSRQLAPCRIRMVGAAGFEPATPCSQSRCATGLRHAPTQQFAARTYRGPCAASNTHDGAGGRPTRPKCVTASSLSVKPDPGFRRKYRFTGQGVASSPGDADHPPVGKLASTARRNWRLAARSSPVRQTVTSNGRSGDPPHWRRRCSAQG